MQGAGGKGSASWAHLRSALVGALVTALMVPLVGQNGSKSYRSVEIVIK